MAALDMETSGQTELEALVSSENINLLTEAFSTPRPSLIIYAKEPEYKTSFTDGLSLLHIEL